MRHTDYDPFCSYSRPRVSLSLRRLVLTSACTALCCLNLGVLTAVRAQDTPPATEKMQGKKGHKKSHASMPAKAQTKKGIADMSARVIVVFPPETKGGVSDQISDAITEVVQSRLNLSGKYRTVYFLPSAPTIRRGFLENTLTKEEVDKPLGTDARIKKLTMLTGHDMAFAVSVIDYQFDKATNKVSMVLSAKMLDYTGGTPRGTNRNGESPDKPSAKATEYDLAAALARDLTEKMVSDLLAPRKTTTASDADKK